MILHFRGGNISEDISIIKETKKYIVFRCHDNTMRYRYNKETGEVQNGTYHNVIKGMWLEIKNGIIGGKNNGIRNHLEWRRTGRTWRTKWYF